ncbi:hypothetical protein Bca101_059394 [Brassica carinata]
MESSRERRERFMEGGDKGGHQTSSPPCHDSMEFQGTNTSSLAVRKLFLLIEKLEYLN